MFIFSIIKNFKEYLYVGGIVLAIMLGGYVWFKLNHDEAKIISLTNQNTQLQSSLSALQLSQSTLENDISMVQQQTAIANSAISNIQSNAAKNAEAISNTNYQSQADSNSETLTNTVNSNVANMFGQIEQSTQQDIKK